MHKSLLTRELRAPSPFFGPAIVPIRAFVNTVQSYGPDESYGPELPVKPPGGCATFT